MAQIYDFKKAREERTYRKIASLLSTSKQNHWVHVCHGKPYNRFGIQVNVPLGQSCPACGKRYWNDNHD